MTNLPPAPMSAIAAAYTHGDTDTLRQQLVALLGRPDAAAQIRALDAAGLLTRIIPELEPARSTDQPHIHFLPVLQHMFETVSALAWLLAQIAGEVAPMLPEGIRANPSLAYRSTYQPQLAEHFAGNVGRYPRAALFKFAALLHDIAKPQTLRRNPDGTVSFHEHQTIGGEVAAAVAQRLGFNTEETRYIRLIVREHMRPGQLAILPEITMRAVQRFFTATDDAGPDVLLHLLADHMATRGPLLNVRSWIAQARWIDAMLDTIWGEPLAVTPPLANGNDLMRELGLAPGPQIGALLAAIGEAQADGAITTHEEALALARRMLAKR
jgi:poly(A) polymerase/tRNA nucleotidyltransferase (CCA-adding enzyme)